MFTEDELIKKKDIFDPIEDDDDIDWNYNPFDVDLIDEFYLLEDTATPILQTDASDYGIYICKCSLP